MTPAAAAPTCGCGARTQGENGFGEPTRVNDTADDDTTTRYLPALAQARGRLDVVYYDRRDDPDNVFNHVSLQSSHNNGETFTPRARQTTAAL